MNSTPVIYISHPYGGDPKNLELAAAWCDWLERRYECLVTAPWIDECSETPEKPQTRAEGIERSKRECRSCYAAALCGSMKATGMAIETAGHPRRIDIFPLGLQRPPDPLNIDAISYIDELMRCAGIRLRRAG
jgi:hypothetical protein